MNRRSIGVAVCVALPVIGVACGGSNSPGTPSKPAVSVSTVVITASTDLLKVGETSTFAGNAMHSDGSSAPISQWSSDAPTVATVDVTGLVRGVGNGRATIVGTHDGMTGTKLIRVVPNYGGSWEGDYTVSGCTQSGDFALVNYCGLLSGTVYPLDLILTQNRDNVTGTLYLGTINGSITGPVDDYGRLIASGQLRSGQFTYTLANWITTADANNRMTGTFDWTIGNPTFYGSARASLTIRTLTKSAAVATGIRSGRTSAARTIADAVAALGGR